MASEYDGQQFVGIDLHRRRSVVVRQDADGEVLEQVRIDNDAMALACEIEKAARIDSIVDSRSAKLTTQGGGICGDS